MNYLYEFADTITEFMLNKSMTIKDFSHAVNISAPVVGQWIRQEIFPTAASAVKVADYLDCSLDYLFGRSSQREFIRAASPVSFKARLKDILCAQSTSRYKIARACGIEPSLMSKWLLNGCMPKIESLLKLADYFNCSLDYLVGRSDAK